VVRRGNRALAGYLAHHFGFDAATGLWPVTLLTTSVRIQSWALFSFIIDYLLLIIVSEEA
jgi:hypothetical protein